MIVNITDDEVVEDWSEYFYIRLTTNDTRIELLRIREQQAREQVCISDNDSKFIGMIHRHCVN